MDIKLRYAHGIFYPIAGVEPLPVKQPVIYHTEGAKTNYELWQMEKHGNYIKAQGSEYTERYMQKETL